MDLKVLFLDVPPEDNEAAYNAGARYSSKYDRWYVFESIARYPQARFKLFRSWMTKDVLNWSNECYFSTLVLEQLRSDFHIYEQVRGIHPTGSILTIDAVIKPKCIAGWKNPNVAIGIEFKDPKNVSAKSDHTYWVKQCIDYSYTAWDEFGTIAILLGPGLNDVWRSNQFISDLLSKFMIGRITMSSGLHFEFACKRIWSEGYGVQEIGRKSMLVPIIGSQ